MKYKNMRAVVFESSQYCMSKRCPRRIIKTLWCNTIITEINAIVNDQ